MANYVFALREMLFLIFKKASQRLEILLLPRIKITSLNLLRTIWFLRITLFSLHILLLPRN